MLQLAAHNQTERKQSLDTEFIDLKPNTWLDQTGPLTMGRRKQEDAFPGEASTNLRERSRVVERDANALSSAPYDMRSRRRRGSEWEATPRRLRRGSSQSSEGSMQSTDSDVHQREGVSARIPPRRLNRSATAPAMHREGVETNDIEHAMNYMTLARRQTSEIARSPRRDQNWHSSRQRGNDSFSDEASEASDNASSGLGSENDQTEMSDEADDEADRQPNRIIAADSSADRIAARRRDRMRDRTPSPQPETDHVADLHHTGPPPPYHLDHHDSRHAQVMQHSPASRDAHRSRRGSRHSHLPPQLGESPRDRQMVPINAPHTPSRTIALVHDQSSSMHPSTNESSRSSTASLRQPPNAHIGYDSPPQSGRKIAKQSSSRRPQRGEDTLSHRVECIACSGTFSPKRAAHLRCDHYMCRDCLQRVFKLSVQDPASHMPPVCCTKHHIPVRHVEKLFDAHFKRRWNRKYTEYTTKNRLYCPAKRCGHFIKPSRIKDHKGRPSARCSHCNTKVCARCSNRWHKTVECPADAETSAFLEEAKRHGWQRCYNCKSMVEHAEGCNHMTCRCGGQFCMLCGSKWRTCECPWFSDEAVAADRMIYMNGNVPPPRGDIDDIFDGDGPPMPPEMRYSAYEAYPTPRATRPRAHSQSEEIFTRRLREDADADLARRIQVYEEVDDSYGSMRHDMRGGMSDVIGIGNAAGHHMNSHYHRSRRVPGTRSAIAATPLATSYERGPGYVPDVSRARGVRESSMERRLAERLGERRSTRSPQSRSVVGPGPMMPQPSSPYSRYGVSPTGAVDPTTGMPILLESHPYEQAPGSPYYQHVPRSAGMGREYYENYEAPPMEIHGHRRRKSSKSDREDSITGSLNGKIRSSSLAGLTGPGQGMDRVEEWNSYVPTGNPDVPA